MASRKDKDRFSVAVFLNRKSDTSREQAEGVFRYAARCDSWELHLYSRPETPAAARRLAEAIPAPDGMISGAADIVAAIREKRGRRIPAVLIDENAAGRAGMDGLVLCDDHAIGTHAAEFFVSRGYVSFAFAGITGTASGDPDATNSRNRENGFRRILAKHGYTVSSYAEDMPPGGLHYIDETSLWNWIRSLPKPCAMLACSDAVAQSVIAMCRRHRVAVPRQISVMGVGNDASICENTSPTLSSIGLDGVGGGLRAAEILDNAMRRRRPGTVRAKYGVSDIVTRMSTASISGQRSRAERAMDTIRRRACSGITAKELANEMGVTVRTLELTFKAASFGTVRDEILKVRLAEAMRLARRTSLRTDEIAARCGFRTTAALKALFRKRFGTSVRGCRTPVRT